MNIILKHTIKSATQHKVQVAIIIVTIMLATVMIFAGFSMSEVFYNINITEYNRVAQGADMLLGENSGGSEVFSKARVEALLSERPNEIASVEYFLKLPTIMATKDSNHVVLVEATNLKEYLNKHELRFIDKYTGKEDAPPGADITSEYYPMIIGETFAKNMNLKVGDTAKVYLAEYDAYSTLYVMYIAEDAGIFSSSSNMNILVDTSAVTNHEQVNAVYINFTDPQYFTKYEDVFAEHLPAIKVTEGDNQTHVLEIVKQNTMLLSLAIVFIVVAMMLILLTSYLIIARNRMSEMVIFKSAGATPKQVTAIMLLEVLLYAIVGAVLGVVLCRLLLKIGTMVLLPYVKNPFTYSWWKYVVSILIAVSVTVCATLVPIIQTSKQTIRESLSAEGKAEQTKIVPIYVIIAIVINAIVAGVVVNFVSGIWAYILAGYIVLSVCAIIAFCCRSAIAFWCKVWAKVCKSGASRLASITAKRNRAMHTITVLLSVVIVFSFVVVEIVDIVKIAITPTQDRYEADYVALVGEKKYKSTLDIAIKDRLMSNQEIAYAGYYSEVSFLQNPNSTKNSIKVMGVNAYQTIEMSADIKSNVFEAWQNTVNPAILSTDMLLRFNCKVGDKIRLYVNSTDHKGEFVEFTVIGEDTAETNNDRILFTRYDTIADYAQTSVILINGTGEESFADIRTIVDELEFEKTYVLSRENWAIGGAVYDGIDVLLTLLQYAMYAVCMLGLINIVIVTMFDRKQEFALYALSGMSSADYKKFAMAEAGIVGISGATIGMFAGVVLAQILPVVAIIINKFMYFGIVPVATIVVAIVGGLCLFAGWALLSSLNTSNKPISINNRYKI